MQRPHHRLFVVAVLASVFALPITTKFHVPVVHAQDRAQDACSVATLMGGYGFNTLTAFARPDANKTRFVPDVATGMVVFDGAGSFSGKATDVTDSGGAPESPPFRFALVGTYTLEGDCTGSITEANSGTHLDIVVVGNGREIEAIQTEPQKTRTFEFKEITTQTH